MVYSGFRHFRILPAVFLLMISAGALSAQTNLGIYAGGLFGYGYDNYSTKLTAFQNYNLNRDEHSLSAALQVGMKWALFYSGMDFVMTGTQTVEDDRWTTSTELYDYNAGELFIGLAGFYPFTTPTGWEVSPGLGTEFTMALYRTMNDYDLLEEQDLAMDLLLNGCLRLNSPSFGPFMFTSLIMGGYNFFPDPYNNQSELREESFELRLRALFGIVYRFG